MHTKNHLLKTAPLNIIAQLILLISAIYMVYIIFSGSNVMKSGFDSDVFKRRYEQSQWVVPGSRKPIGDEWLYAYAAYRYMQGDSPTAINPEVPPVGKYIIGLGILTLHNYQVSSTVAAILCLVLVFIAVRMAAGAMLPASIAVFLTAFHPLFSDQIIHSPQLDIYQLLFLLGCFVCLQMYEKSRSNGWYIVTGVCLGLFIGTKIFLLFLGLTVTWLAVYILMSRQLKLHHILRFAGILCIALVVFVASYSMFFVRGGTLYSFLGAQKWIYTFYADAGIQSPQLFGAYIPLIFMNRWKVWGQTITSVPYEHWTIQWPAIAVLGVLSGILLRKHITLQRRTLYLLTVSFLFVYAVLMFLIPIFPRYLLLMFVSMHILIALFFDTIVKT